MMYVATTIGGFLGITLGVILGIFIIYIAVSLGSEAYFRRYRDFLIWQKKFWKE